MGWHRFESLKRSIFSLRGQEATLKTSLADAEAELKSLTEASAVESDVLRLLQLSHASTWNTTKTVVEGLVTRALSAIFYDKSYAFVLTQEIKRGVPNVSFSILDDDMTLDVADEVGGGISDVVALVLRIAFVALYRPKVRPFLVLDEPLRHLSVSYQPYAAKFLQQVCKELGIELLVVTHQKELAADADQVFRIQKLGNVCSVIWQASFS